MNYITGSFSPAVSKSTVKMPVDPSGAPLVVDEDKIKVIVLTLANIGRILIRTCLSLQTFRSFFETYNAM